MIKLTGFSNSEPLWINPDKVTLIEKREVFSGMATCIDFEKGLDAAVQESPEEVVKMIEEAKKEVNIEYRYDSGEIA